MFIQNAIYKSIPVGSLSLPVAAGTIVTINGNLATSADNTFGIVPETITSFPPTGRIRVAVAGQIDLDQSPELASKVEWLSKDFNLVPAEEAGGGGGASVPEPTSGGGQRLLFANNAGTISWTATNTFIKMTQMTASSYEGSTGVQLKNWANQNMSPANLIAAMTNGAGFYIEDSYYPGSKLLPAFIEYKSISASQYRYNVYCIVDSSGTMSMYYTSNDTKTT